MADHTHIEWTDATWNPVTGCSVVSPGCTNCYAMRWAWRLQHHPSRAGLTRAAKAGPVWSGEVRFNPDWIDQPLRWRKPRRIFVCAHGDLFHENVPEWMIDRVFVVMALARQHTFQVLTKRAGRMRTYLSDPSLMGRLSKVALRGFPGIDGHPGVRRFLFDHPDRVTFPLPNVHMGVSVEDQPRADERLPHLVATPAAVRFVSLEPMIGPVDLLPWLFIVTHDDAYALAACDCDGERPILPFRDPATTPADDIAEHRVDWVIVGGESGPGARPMHPGWARMVRADCAAAQVPFFFKQWGAWAGCAWNDGDWPTDRPGCARLRIDGSRGPDGWPMQRVGKVAAGRLLDGREHNDLPAPRALTATGA